jgi:ABC-2 type transport system permease protein
LVNKLRNLIIKEIKELARDPKILLGMILVPLIMFPLMGWIIRFSFTTAQESLKTINVVIMDLDQNEIAKNLTEYLQNAGVKVFVTKNTSFDETVGDMQQMNASDLVVIPENFTARVKAGEKPILKTYTIFTGKGIVEGVSSSVIAVLLENFKKTLSPDPFVIQQGSIVNGNPVPYNPQALSSFLMSQYIMLPVTIMVLLIFAMQLAATSVAMEKEEKTLETLLSLPIDRLSILAGKLTGSVIVAAIGAVAYLIGFNYYMNAFTFTASEGATIPDLAVLGLMPSTLAYVLMGISLFVTLISALALAVIFSAFAEDVRSAQAIVGYVYPLLFVPMFLLMFADFNSLPLVVKIALWLIPYSHPVLAARAALTGDYVMIIGGIVYVLCFTLAILYIAAKLFATEKIFTVRIKMGRFRFRKAKVSKSE